MISCVRVLGLGYRDRCKSLPTGASGWQTDEVHPSSDGGHYGGPLYLRNSPLFVDHTAVLEARLTPTQETATVEYTNPGWQVLFPPLTWGMLLDTVEYLSRFV